MPETPPVFLPYQKQLMQSVYDNPVTVEEALPIVAEGYRLREIFVKTKRHRHGAGDLRHL